MSAASRVIAAAALAGLAASGCSDPAPPPTLSTMSASAVQQFEKMAASRAADDAKAKRAAEELNADGDREYLKANYRKAFRMYYSSYPNFPNAYAYIMTGDSHWRFVAQSGPSKMPGAPPDSVCDASGHSFARALSLDLEQNYSMGFALAEHDNDRQLLQSPMYQRARASAACLHEMAREYPATKPDSACADLAHLKRCLGEPLIP